MTNSTELSHMSKAVVSSRRTERRLIKGKSQPGRGMRVRIFVQGERRELNPTIQEQLFLIGREAVMNALRHSEATEIAVEVQYLGDRMRVSVRDNGRGIDPEAAQKRAIRTGVFGGCAIERKTSVRDSKYEAGPLRGLKWELSFRLTSRAIDSAQAIFSVWETTYMNTLWINRSAGERKKAEATSALCAPATRRQSTQLVLLMPVIIVMFSLALVGCAQSKASIQLPPPEVLVASPVQRDVPVHSEWVATLQGYTNAEIRPQVSGYLIKQNYKEGSEVSKGQVLFEIDPRPFQATLDRARGELATAEGSLARSKAELSRAKAQLGEAQAALGKATIDVDRDTPLVAQRAVAKEKLDTAIQAKKAAQASVESAQAVIESSQAAILAAQAQVVADQATVELAELDLGWTKVTSLVDGIAGIAQVQMGNLVGPTTQLTNVSQVDPIKVYFPVSEQEYLRAKHVSGQPIELFDSSPELILADGTVYPRKGKIVITDRQVDTATGTVRLVAAFPNPGNVLRPGGYGRVRIETNIEKAALLVPQSAVKEIQGGYEVALVTADKKAILRPVKAGEKFGTMWAIDDGLKRDDQVVVEGIANVKDGIPVAPKPVKIQAEGR